MEDDRLLAIHEEIVQVLLQQDASYARPMPSWELARLLNVAPSYVREQVGVLRRHRLVSVRRGRGGGYYLSPANRQRHHARMRRSAPGTTTGPAN